MCEFWEWKSVLPHQPRSDPRRPRDRGPPVAPEDGVARHEVGQRAREEGEPAEDAEDVEDGEPAGAVVWVWI